MGLLNRFKKKETKNEETTLYILCQEEDSNAILRAFDTVFGTSIADGGVNDGVLQNGDLSIEVVAYGQDLGEKCGEFIKKQVGGVCGHFAQVETEKVDVKINALHQLTGSRGFVNLKCTYPAGGRGQLEEMAYPPIFEVLAKVRGLLLTDHASALFGEEGKLVFSDKGESQMEWFMPYERPLPEHFFEGAPADALRRRNENLAAICARHIHVTEWLPLIESEEEASFRTAEEIAGRAAALLIVALYSEYLLSEEADVGKAREFIEPVKRCYGAEQYFSPAEQAYLDNDDSTEQDRIQFVWQYEPLFVMLWALGYEEELFFPDHICDVPGITQVMRERDSMEALLKGAKLRSGKELLDAADMIFRLDWACVDTRIHGLPAPAGMDSGVVMERHKALNWLVCGDEWDKVDIST